MPKQTPVPIADFIKYGIIVLTAGIQIGMFYETKKTVEKLVTELTQLKQDFNMLSTDSKILEVKLKSRGVIQ